MLWAELAVAEYSLKTEEKYQILVISHMRIKNQELALPPCSDFPYREQVG